jgi:hypothetical protein
LFKFGLSAHLFQLQFRTRRYIFLRWYSRIVNRFGNRLADVIVIVKDQAMLKQNAFLLCAGIMAILVLGSVFSTALFATGSAQIQRAGVGTAPPAQSFINSYSAYPRSCLVDGLPLGKSSVDPSAKTQPVALYAYNTTAAGYVSEIDSVSIWRVPCSGGIAATILELDRPTALDGSTTQSPLFPYVSVATAASGTTSFIPRLAQEPNTLFEDTPAGSSFYSSTVYVLEYYNPGNPTNPASAAVSSSVDYNQAFILSIENQAGGSPLVINVPAYVPPTSSLMPISGYMSTNWTSSTQGGEGIVLQVYDDHDNATRTLAFAWFTYDDNGLPFWLFGEADAFAIGSQSVTATTAYFTGGTFAGNLPAGVPHTIWGTVTFTFPDCGHMNINYSGNAAAVHGPTGSGGATFQRVADVNGLVCQ